MRCRRAFTLIEVLLAIAIMAILAGAATFAFRKPLEAARVRDTREQVRFLDATARDAARRFGRDVEIVFDLSRGTLARRESGRSTYRSALPPGYRIDTVRTAGRRSSGGEVAIPCSALGLTPSYALHLRGAGLDQWVLVAGLGGELRTLPDESSLDAIFRTEPSRKAARDDAD